MDAIEQNKNTVISFIDALFTKGDLGAVDEYLAGEFVNHDPPIGVTADREGMRAAWSCGYRPGRTVGQLIRSRGTPQDAGSDGRARCMRSVSHSPAR